MPPRCSSHVIIWLVLVGPLLGLLYAFLLLNSSSPVLPLGLYLCYFGLPWPISSLSSSLGPFYFFEHLGPFHFLGHLRPIPILHSYGFLLSLLGFLGLSYHILNSFLWVPSAHSCLLSISHNTHAFTTSFFRLLWACLLSLIPFCYFTDLWSIIPAIWV